MDVEQFKFEFWKQYNSCYSEEDFANLLAWIYFHVEDEQYYEELPFDAAVAEVWKVCPSAVNKFIEHGGSSLPALMMVTVRNNLLDMPKEKYVKLEEKLEVDYFIKRINENRLVHIMVTGKSGTGLSN